MKIKLMQITHDLAIGGLQQVVVNICKTINHDKFDVSVLCLRAMGEYVSDIEKLGLKVYCLPHKGKYTDYFKFIKVAGLLRKERINIIHTHNTQPLIDGTLGALLSGVKTIVHTDHARDFPDKRRYMFAEYIFAKFAYRVVGVSEHTSANLIKYEKINPKKIITLENGILGTRFDITINKKEKRKELGVREKGPVIGLGVRLVEQKGISYLLKAMPKIIKKYPDVTLLIVGDGKLKTKLHKEVLKLGIKNNVLFSGVRLDIPEILKLLDIYVLPSLWEGMPLVLIEAMAAGCAIVATNVGGVSKLIEDNYNGLLVDPRNPDQLSTAIIKLLKDDSLHSKFVKNGLEKFKEKYSAEKMTEKYERLYMRI